jgi:hypothetical protein
MVMPGRMEGWRTAQSQALKGLGGRELESSSLEAGSPGRQWPEVLRTRSGT